MMGQGPSVRSVLRSVVWRGPDGSQINLSGSTCGQHILCWDTEARIRADTQYETCLSLLLFSSFYYPNITMARTPKSVPGALKRVNKKEGGDGKKVKQSNAATRKSTTTTSSGVVVLPQRPPAYGSRCADSVQCWAHSMTGTRCTRMVKSREGEPVPIPYCDAHLESGDGALKVVNHPFAGKALVARYDLPAKYRIVFWGNRGRCDDCNKEDRAISYYPPDKETGRRKEDVDTYNGVLNPAGSGDIIQYAACPGPNERQNMRSTSQYWGVRNGNLGGLEFITLEPVPKDTQLCHWYGPGWWSARGVKRMDVGTKKYPAPLRTAKSDKA